MTAVEYLLDGIRTLTGLNIADDEPVVEKAKEMEKNQIIDAHLDGQCFSTTIEEFDYAEQYYNETFKK